ncbi:Pyruvate kinase, cytosolic isozyme, partial [Tetrabaena socialis]
APGASSASPQPSGTLPEYPSEGPSVPNLERPSILGMDASPLRTRTRSSSASVSAGGGTQFPSLSPATFRGPPGAAARAGPPQLPSPRGAFDAAADAAAAEAERAASGTSALGAAQVAISPSTSPRRVGVPSRGGPPVAPKTLSLRTTAISLEDVLGQRPGAAGGRKTKVVCTLGPACWSEEGLAALLDAGMDVARFNFSHGTHAAHQEVLDRLHKVLKARGTSRRTAFLLDTKGPEVRTAMLRGGKDITLEAGQEVTVVAVGDDYDTYEGFKDEATGETKIGLSYAKLCQSVVPGSRILIADGTLSIEVLEITSPTELRGRCLNAKTLGQRKNCNLP